MNDMKFRLFVNSLAGGALFGLWQQNYTAGCFMFVAMGFVLSCIDYFKASK